MAAELQARKRARMGYNSAPLPHRIVSRMADADLEKLEKLLHEFIVPQTGAPLGRQGTALQTEGSPGNCTVRVTLGFPAARSGAALVAALLAPGVQPGLLDRICRSGEFPAVMLDGLFVADPRFDAQVTRAAELSCDAAAGKPVRRWNPVFSERSQRW